MRERSAFEDRGERPLIVAPRGRRWRRRRMRQRPSGGVALLLLLLRLGLVLTPGVPRHVAAVAAGYELRGPVEVRRCHHRRLLLLASVSHFTGFRKGFPNVSRIIPAVLQLAHIFFVTWPRQRHRVCACFFLSFIYSALCIFLFIESLLCFYKGVLLH